MRLHLELANPYTRHAMRTWCSLGASSFFLTWSWIENWLSTIPKKLAPTLAVLYAGNAPISACFLGRRNVVRHKLIPSRALYLNNTGDPRFDDVCLEYNGVVGQEVSIGTLVRLLPGDWDELFLPLVSDDAFGGLRDGSIEGAQNECEVKVERRIPVHYVDLNQVRESGYLPLLGKSTRAQIRKARRDLAPLKLTAAKTKEEAAEIYKELVELHTERWQSVGQPGVFADPWFDAFHKRLIAQRFEHGEIQLLRVEGARGTVGCLYNFVWQGKVLQYQSGFSSRADRRAVPGFVSHAAAIEYNAALGHQVYDLLAGDAQYKERLSTSSTSMAVARVQKKLARFAIEDRLRSLVKTRGTP